MLPGEAALIAQAIGQVLATGIGGACALLFLWLYLKERTAHMTTLERHAGVQSALQREVIGAVDKIGDLFEAYEEERETLERRATDAERRASEAERRLSEAQAQLAAHLRAPLRIPRPERRSRPELPSGGGDRG